MEKLITVDKLQEKLSEREPLLILDVRPSDQRKEWRIAESIHIDAYERLIGGDDAALDQVEVPKNATVVTVCAAGRTSLLAADLLQRKGVKALSLEGGMKAWNYAWNKAEARFSKDVKVIQIRRPAKGVLSYIVGSANEAIVIDASLNPDVYLKIAKENAWTIKFVMDTHIHADFVSRTRDLANQSGAKHLLLDKAQVEFQFTPVTSGQSISFGNAQLQVIHTPGHTWESASIKLDDTAIFSGDTLFIDGIGRPDLKSGEAETIEKAKSLYTSLKALLSLPPSMLVLPAHTSIAIPFDNKIVGDSIMEVRGRIPQVNLSEAEFVDYALSRVPPTPPNYLVIAGINRKGSYDGHNLSDLEAGGNHCAIA